MKGGPLWCIALSQFSESFVLLRNVNHVDPTRGCVSKRLDVTLISYLNPIQFIYIRTLTNFCVVSFQFVKCGYAGSNFPAHIFPSMVGRPIIRAVNKIGDIEVKVNINLKIKLLKYGTVAELYRTFQYITDKLCIEGLKITYN